MDACDKASDTFCPVGPWVDTEFDPSDAVITCRVSVATRCQMASTRDMVFNVSMLIVFISSEATTLEPGDLIFTGTPAGVVASWMVMRWWWKSKDWGN